MITTSTPQSPLTDALLPHDLAYHFLDGTCHEVRVEADMDAVLDDWRRHGRVELMLFGRALVVENDLNGTGLRVVDPVGRMPLAAFRPGRHGGRVDLPDGAVLRWLAPTRSVFESGFVAAQERNVVRFTHDGTAIVLVNAAELAELAELADTAGLADPAEPAEVAVPAQAGRPADTAVPGEAPDVLVLLVLGWFLRLTGGAGGRHGGGRRAERGPWHHPGLDGRPEALRRRPASPVPSSASRADRPPVTAPQGRTSKVPTRVLAG
jgi:hypothetical protein